MTTFNLVTIFPEFFDSPLNIGLIARARVRNILDFRFHNPRDFSLDRHRHVDDRPFGGGPGMVMRPEPLCAALESINQPGRILLMSPSGKQFSQGMAEDIAREQNITIICGRYEGIDARVAELFNIEEICTCQAVLNGGETAALTVIEAVARLLPGFLGKTESAHDESFSNGLLEYPQYTRPEEFVGHLVPEILRSGNHAAIAGWRRCQSLKKTLQNRPAMLNDAQLDKKDAKWLTQNTLTRAGRNLSFCLLHWPVLLDRRQNGISSLTNLDIHDIARISRSYGMGPFFVLTPLMDQLELLRKILRHWLETKEREATDRRRALELVRPVSSFVELEESATEFYGKQPEYVATSAAWPAKTTKTVSCADVFAMCSKQPVLLCLGTARGLDLKSLPFKFAQLRPLRFIGENHLSVRSAAAIMADRILGDYH